MKIGSVVSELATITQKLMILFSIAMTSAILYGVFRRYILNKAVPWSEESAIILMIWIVYLGISVAAKEDGHIGMFILHGFLPETVKKYLKLFINLLIMLFLIVISHQGIILSIAVIQQKTPALRVSFFWAYLSVPVGCLLMIVQVMHASWLSFRKIKAEPTPSNHRAEDS